jgi:hypothetical protein
MAIRRCPYCKAIIDEQDKYCNNCGTQLLFPEDEYVEEEIPGDKIIDDEEADEEEEEEELVEEDLGEAASIEEEEEEEETSDKLEKTEEEEEEEPEEEEEEIEPEEQEGIEEEEEKEEPEQKYATARETSLEESLGERAAEDEVTEGENIEERIEETEEEPEDEEELLEPRLTPQNEEERAKKYEVSIEEDELVFKTKDLDKLTGTVDEGKENLEEFLESFQEKAAQPKKPTSDTKEELPPWVRGIKGGVTPEELEEEAEEEEEEEESGEVEEEKPPPRPEWTTDSGIGIPERVTQTELSATDAAGQATEEEEEVVAEEEDEEASGFDRGELRLRPGFFFKFKAKLVDLVFITALWLISLWFTSQVMGVSFFKIIAGSPGPVLAFYFILLLLYFFLFLYFLGETLGDHYFSGED